MSNKSVWPQVTIAILNYNGAQLLPRYLPGVVATDYPNLKVLVIDNASSDDSLIYLKDAFPEIEVLSLNQNLGYAGGYAKGLEQIKEGYILLLNSDVRVQGNWIRPLVKHMMDHPNTGAVQPKLRWDRLPSHFEYSGASGGYLDYLGYPFCRGRIFEIVESDHGQYDLPAQVFWASGAALMVQARAYHKAGGLDPMFFAHMEEIDLCWRMQRLGYRVDCVPASIVYHLGGATLASDSAFKTYLNFRNNQLVLLKNLQGTELLWKWPLRMLLDLLAAVRFLGQAKWKHFLAICRAQAWVWFRAPGIVLARKGPFLAMKQLKGTYHKSLVRAHFIKGQSVWSALDKKAFI